MEASAALTIEALQLSNSSNALVCLDTKYIAGQMMLVRAFVNGMNIIATEPTANPFKNISQPIDFTALVPYQVEAILQEGNSANLDALKCCIIGGATISESLKKKLKEIKSPMFATYGMTETISHIALQKLNGDDANENFHVLGDTKISQDERGCLMIDADYLDDQVTTNDLVTITDAKHFTWLGRFDNVINSGGVKVSPEPIETKIESIFDDEGIFNRCFVAGIPDNKLGQRVALFVEGNPFTQETQKEILSKLSSQISKFEVPKEIRFVSVFEETKTGKVNRLATIRNSKV